MTGSAQSGPKKLFGFRWLCRSIAVLFILAALAAAQQPRSREAPVALSSLLRATDPLASQDLIFDATEARQAIAYLHSHDPALLDAISQSPAVSLIRDHARNFDYDVPKESPAALVNSLLGPQDKQALRIATCESSLAYFSGPLLSDPHWINDDLHYLPAGFRYHGSLFLTFGYDIGVAFGPNASLNCTHSHFDQHPDELLYYAIHELHHVGFMAYQKPPKLAELKSCADLLNLVEYSTQLEGMAVLAAYERRRQAHALANDPDYVALQDNAQMQRNLESYFRDYEYLKRRGNQPADADAWAVIDRMSSGNRLWYRVGAYMAQRIESSKGTAALTALVKQGPSRFMLTYNSLGPPVL